MKLKLAAGTIILASSAFVAQGALVAEYNFEEGSGTTAVDSSGNSLNGVINGGATWVSGFNGGTALNLDGVDDFVALHANTFAGMGSTVSISAWVLGGPSNPKRSTFFWGAQNADGTGRQLQVHLPWENGQAYWRAPGGQVGVVLTAAQTSGTWNHWAFTKESSTGAIKIYANGVEIAGGTNSTNTFSVAQGYLGIDPNDVARAYEGAIDDFKVYNHELSLSEVQALAGVPEPSSVLLTGLAALGFVGRRRR
ncbi:PEP-CTERM sorting domain-containing protein [Akkermansiaceae bacterium]|nr:PEP-CTERM sorting domain-containing protein [Akkermansiaceae bacterium]